MDDFNPRSRVDEANSPPGPPSRGHVSHPNLASQRPDFLVISPPKTGSTWLADNLRRHPQVFLPGVKEVKYFSRFLRSLDLNWYLDHFAAAPGRVKGEASPCYSLLPQERIRLVRRLMPDVKLVYLMRDPVERAWSHAKHNHRYGEANFAPRPSALESVTDGEWRANFVHDWPLACGDYRGQLRRWLAVFPREQIYVGFYEAIGKRPAALLREIFSFLGVDADVDLCAFPITERILPGPSLELSAGLRRFLHGLLDGRTADLAGFLRRRLGLEPPAAWGGPLGCDPDAAPSGRSNGRKDFDDGRLSEILTRADSFRSAYRLVAEDYLGYRVASWRGRLFALARSLGSIDPREADGRTLRQLQDAGNCFIGGTLDAIEERVARHVRRRGGAAEAGRFGAAVPDAVTAAMSGGGRRPGVWRRLRTLLAEWLTPRRRRSAPHAD